MFTKLDHEQHTSNGNCFSLGTRGPWTLSVWEGSMFLTCQGTNMDASHQ